MAEKRAHHPMHVKRRTRGSSNEISFSVLDAAREAREAEEGDRRDSTVVGSLFTLGKGKKPRATPVKDQAIVYSGNTAAPTATGASRGMRAIVPVVVVVCVLLALVLAGGQTALSIHEHQKSLIEILNSQMATIEACDSSLIPFDTLVMEQSDPKRLSPSATGEKAPSVEALSEGYREVVAEIAPMRIDLQESIDAMEELQRSLSSNDDKEAAAQVVTAARSRLNMLDAGVGIIEESLAATQAFINARVGWKAVIDADAAAREATALMEEMTEQNVTASRRKSEEALGLLQKAEQEFSQAEADYPGLKLTAFSEYAAKRAASQQAALAADDAYLERNKEELAAQNERYNALEDEAATLAQSLGDDDPEQIVARRFYENIDPDVTSYEAERLKAGNADAFLREYLGTAS